MCCNSTQPIIFLHKWQPNKSTLKVSVISNKPYPWIHLSTIDILSYIRSKCNRADLFFQSVTTLQPHISNKRPSVSSSHTHCVGFMGKMILWHLLQSDRPISAPSIQTSVPTQCSSCLVSAVSTLSLAFRLSAMSKAQRSRYSPRATSQRSLRTIV